MILHNDNSSANQTQNHPSRNNSEQVQKESSLKNSGALPKSTMPL